MHIFGVFCTSQTVPSFETTENPDFVLEEEKETILFIEIPAGPSVEVVRKRFNRYFGKEGTVQAYKGNHFFIKEGELESPEIYSEGGGNGVRRKFLIKEIPFSEKDD